MSLLLDELKKAANDKVKKAVNDTTHDMEIDLDLDLKDEDECFYGNENTIDVGIDADQKRLLEPEWENKLSLEEKTENTANEENAHANLEPIAGTYVAKNAPSAVIESEQALSDFMNKSNQHSRREKLKIITASVIFISLLFIAIGGYFYFEIKTTHQNIYISLDDQNNIPEKQKYHSQALNPDKVTMPVRKPAESGATNTPKNTTIIAPEKKGSAKTEAISSHKTKAVATSIASEDKKTAITIMHSKKADPVHLLLRDAYDLFNNQNYAEAEKLYKKVLVLEPINRDALLGFAAIATKEKRYEFARKRYQYLIRLNPKDSLAIAGLSMLDHHINSQQNESKLKFMIKQQPDSAHLSFALGTQYATQKKWPQAQSAYFNAWSAEIKNADYSYNLAVSLDHLDKKKQALDFYKLSLRLKQKSSGNFSQEEVQNRIHTLMEIR